MSLSTPQNAILDPIEADILPLGLYIAAAVLLIGILLDRARWMIGEYAGA